MVGSHPSLFLAKGRFRTLHDRFTRVRMAWATSYANGCYHPLTFEAVINAS
jgi:hypothetical protein